MPSAPQHSKLSPSAASRWSVCTASVDFIEQNRAEGILPLEETSKYADEGTVAHSIAASILSGNSQHEWPDLAMSEYVLGYCQTVHEAVGPTDRLLVERRFSLCYKPEDYGTSDATIAGPGRIQVYDLKYGAGVSVEAFENKQLAIYGESLIRELEAVEDVSNDTRIDLVIHQPRDRNNPEPVRTWTLTRAELATFVLPIEAAAQTILSGGETHFVADPEKQCRFCPAKGLCKTYAAYGLQSFSDLTVDETIAGPAMTLLTNPTSLTREQSVRVIQASKGLRAWLEAVEDQEVARLMAGAPPLGMKLVEGKSNRQWADPEAVKKLLRNYLTADEVCPPSDPISPNQAEKLLKGKTTSTKFDNKLKALIVKPEGKATIVPESDPRQALQFPHGATGFENLTLPASS